MLTTIIKHYILYIISYIQNMIIVNQKLSTPSKIRISPIVKICLIPTKNELKIFDLWWNDLLYSTNKNNYLKTQMAIIQKRPNIRKHQLKELILEEMPSLEEIPFL